MPVTWLQQGAAIAGIIGAMIMAYEFLFRTGELQPRLGGLIGRHIDGRTARRSAAK